MQELIKNRASLDIACEDGRTALVQACTNGHLELVRVLVKAGANVDVVMTHPTDGSEWTLLPIVGQLGYVGIMKELIKGGAIVDEGNASGFTALHLASENGRTSIVKALLEAEP